MLRPAGVLRVEEHFTSAIETPDAERLATGDIEVSLGVDSETAASRQTFHRIDDAGLHVDHADATGEPTDIELFLARIEEEAGDAIEAGLVCKTTIAAKIFLAHAGDGA